MIRYALKCEVNHDFEAWFDSSDGFDDQAARGLVECPMCGSTAVSKAIMSPSVRTARGADSLIQAQKAAAEAIYKLRKHVEATADYVGGNFATEARDMHEGLTQERAIYGEATREEVKALVEGGVPVAALPVFTPPKPDDAAVKVLPVADKPAVVDKKLN